MFSWAGWSQQSEAACAVELSGSQHSWVVAEHSSPQLMQYCASVAQEAPGPHAEAAQTFPSQAPLQHSNPAPVAHCPGAPAPPQHCPFVSSWAGWSQQFEADCAMMPSPVQHSCVVGEHSRPQVMQYWASAAHEAPGPHAAAAQTFPSQAPLQQSKPAPIAHCPGAPAPPQHCPFMFSSAGWSQQSAAACAT